MEIFTLKLFNIFNPILGIFLNDGWEDNLRFLDTKLIDVEDFLMLLFRFTINLLVVLYLAKKLYYDHAKRKDFLFSFVLISAMVFLICYSLNNTTLELGFALGLFAVFGIIRYRTDPIPIKEMTYLFLVIGIAVFNALSIKKVSWAEIIATNLIVLLVAYVLEKKWLLKHLTSKVIVYENIELIKQQNRKELIRDLEERTGLSIRKVELGRIDFLRDIARVRIYYYEHENEINLTDDEAEYKYRNDDD